MFSLSIAKGNQNTRIINRTYFLMYIKYKNNNNKKNKKK